MARRKRSHNSSNGCMTGQMLDEAHDTIRELVLNQIYATVETDDLTVESLRTRLWPADVLETLRLALPLANHVYRPRISFDYGEFDLDFATDKWPLIPPATSLANPSAVKDDVARVGNACIAVHREGRLVLHVLDWFNTYGTRGTVRYYWPIILRLLSTDDTRAALSAVSDRHIHGIEPMLPLLRHTATWVAAATLAPEHTNDRDYSTWMIDIHNDRDFNWGGMRIQGGVGPVIYF